MKSRRAWAIRVGRYAGGDVYIGLGWFESVTPPAQRGCPTALFATRREARAALPRVKGSGKFTDARVERVLVTIRPVRRRQER